MLRRVSEHEDARFLYGGHLRDDVRLKLVCGQGGETFTTREACARTDILPRTRKDGQMVETSNSDKLLPSDATAPPEKISNVRPPDKDYRRLACSVSMSCRWCRTRPRSLNVKAHAAGSGCRKCRCRDPTAWLALRTPPFALSADVGQLLRRNERKCERRNVRNAYSGSISQHGSRAIVSDYSRVESQTILIIAVLLPRPLQPSRPNTAVRPRESVAG